MTKTRAQKREQKARERGWKYLAIKTRRGIEITDVKVYWCERINNWVSIPEREEEDN
jgi:hypothetical protein